ncbi:alcohol dehydrogenase catalytic domain-containing protein [Streptomyces sp. HSG2]|uniref:zinc-dependent alcohol dehydrogenase n=2 Tax=unclassified Streptomyces TaxID=2593676 RepID=UPI0019066175|nr:alcohol dehydrogenase catalytic domain-containing protein [Streptomyces sp. HSG2]
MAMRRLTVLGPGRAEWREAPAPRTREASDVLVRPIASAVCDLDRHLVREAPLEPPYALGHEAVGEVVEVGDAVGRLKPGDRVVIPCHVSCGECEECARSMPGACGAVPPFSAYGTPTGRSWGGLFDELVRVPWGERSLVPVPPGVDAVRAAACSDNLVDAYRAVSPTLSGDRDASVLIVGGTPTFGLLTVLVCKALGGTAVHYVDRDAHSVERATALGAAATLIDSYAEPIPGRHDLTVDASAHPRGLRRALISTRPGGTCVSRSVFLSDPPLPYLEIYSSGVTFVTGPPHITPFAPEVLRLIDSETLDPTPLISGPHHYDEAPEVLLDPPAGKPVFVGDRR